MENSNEVYTSGIKGLDRILKGGFPSHSLYSIQGEPGTGKTTLALQFLLEGQRLNQKTLYITFSETEQELRRVAASHHWNIAGISVMDLSVLEDQIKPEAQSTFFHPSEIELNQVFTMVLKRIDEVKPSRIVFDSVSEMRLLAETPLRYRKQILALKQALAARDTTVLFLDDLTVAAKDLQIHSIAHGVINLSKLDHQFGGERRRLKVVKLRGTNFLGGYHDFEIKTGGIDVYPRMTSAHHEKNISEGALKTGSEALNSLLGGGLDRGTSTLLIGAAGTGKSSLAMKFALSATKNKEKAAYFTFDETLTNVFRRSEELGFSLKDAQSKGLIEIQKVDPAELSPGAFAAKVQEYVNSGFKIIVIDSLNGYIQAMPEEQFLILQLHELLAYLNNSGVVTIMTMAQQGLVGSMVSPVDLTYLADTVILTRFFEANGEIKKALSVIKKRTGKHETTIREFSLTKDGVQIGDILHGFEGVLTGVPRYNGDMAKISRNG